VSIAEHAPCISSSLVPAVPGSAASWRPLGRDLWVGRTEAGPVGTIECGRRFVATDAEGRARGAYRSLEAAMAAFGGAPSPGPAPDARSWEPLVLVATLSGAAGALLGVYALVGI
jgi:hypothetical protein